MIKRTIARDGSFVLDGITYRPQCPSSEAYREHTRVIVRRIVGFTVAVRATHDNREITYVGTLN